MDLLPNKIKFRNFFLEISKQKAGNKLKYLILYIAVHFESVAIQDF